MNDIIKPTSHSPVIGHTIVGPAAPTPAEGKLREEYETLRLEFSVVLTDVQVAHSRIEKLENDWCLRFATLEKHWHDRLSTLEVRWYHKVRDWFRKVLSCL